MKGINIFNPVDIERGYYLKIIEYARKNGIDHIQINGPIHNLQKGNIGGMIMYKKYAQFNGEQDLDYVKLNLEVVNECLNISHEYGIKTYVWHHELDLPDGLKEDFPEHNAIVEWSSSNEDVLSFYGSIVPDRLKAIEVVLTSP